MATGRGPRRLVLGEGRPRARHIRLAARIGSPDWRSYGLARHVTPSPTWQRHTVSFEVTESTDESRLQFFVGVTTGTVWLSGTQAARHETILNDNDPGFGADGDWLPTTYYPGEWQATGPFYHDWAPRRPSASVRRWRGPLGPGDHRDRRLHRHHLVARGAGDAWHLIAAAPLDPAEAPFVRRKGSGAPSDRAHPRRSRWCVRADARSRRRCRQ
jgi:hypothetical protein